MRLFSPMRTLPVVLLAAAVGLAGCGDILPKPLPPPALYRLTAARNFPATGASSSTQLQIDVPLADAALDSTRIALSRSATTLDYFADAAWTDRLPLLVQTRLLESFQNAHRLIAVAGGTASTAHGDVVLLVNLRHFEAQYGASGAPQWRVDLNADLVSAADRKVLASRIFTGSVPATENNMTAIVDSADAAWRDVAAQVVDWSAQTLARRPSR
ncbi:MAG TPA: ABC-type transport auxiliary lipoprotein family protein [Stellaceae bacterium]|nr:ABC-type transport auxiliary lipoprotein family protein [Stellaceae bacterium]